MTDDKKRYNYMENVLNVINKKYISLSEANIKRNNQILNSIITVITDKMCEDPLFKMMYTRIFYGGSFYDGLRVGEPDEFDLDLLLTIPKNAGPQIINSNMPGFIHLKLNTLDNFLKTPQADKYKNLEKKLFDEKHYLDSAKVLAWMQGLLDKVFNSFPQIGNNLYLIQTIYGPFHVMKSKGGPALTLRVSSPSGIKMDVDLVTCFEFSGDKWPKEKFLPNPVPSKNTFFIVPKTPKTKATEPIPRYWRLSFQEQERVLIDSKKCLKPTVKLLKKLRDTQLHNKISSYFLKTVALHMVDEMKMKDPQFWDRSLSYVFMTTLLKYRMFLENNEIKYYWNKNNNLLKVIDQATLQNFNCRLKAIIADVEKHPTDPMVIASYLLTPYELSRLNPTEVVEEELASKCQIA